MRLWTALIGLLFAAPSVFADTQFAINLQTSNTFVGDDEYYQEPYSLGLDLGVKIDAWLLTAGYTDFNDFKYDRYDGELRIEIAGPHIRINRKLFTKFFDFYAGGGIHELRSDVLFYNNELQQETTTCPSLSVTLSKNFAKFFALQFAAEHIYDVGGRDLLSVGVNALFTF